MATSHKPDDTVTTREPHGTLEAVYPSTDSLTFTVALPVPVHEAPEDEAAVASHDIAINPEYLNGLSRATTTIMLSPDAVTTMPEEPVEVIAEIPALPEPDVVASRRARTRRAIAPALAPTPEPASALTVERLVRKGRATRAPALEGFLQRLLYDATLHLVNIGDSYAVRERKALDARIARRLHGGARFVPVLSRKGGVGKTTIAALMAMAMAEVRDDRVIAIDANPDRGTLADRVVKNTNATVRDVVTRAASITAFSEFQSLISRDHTRLDVLASDADPTASDAFDADSYNVVADMAERFYSMIVTDCGTSIVHSVMGATLQRADSIVVVSGGSVDEARLASETLTWLEFNGYPELAGNAIVAINTGTQGTNLVKLEQIEAHFRSRVRDIVRIPYDATLATGSVIDFDLVTPHTRSVARELAALVVDGLPTERAI